MKIASFHNPIKATMLRWGSHVVPDCTMIPGEYVRIGKRKWAVWLGDAPSIKYIYQIPKGAKDARLRLDAPDLLTALENLMKRAVKDAEHYAPDGNEPIWAFIIEASDAIGKAKERA